MKVSLCSTCLDAKADRSRKTPNRFFYEGHKLYLNLDPRVLMVPKGLNLLMKTINVASLSARILESFQNTFLRDPKYVCSSCVLIIKKCKLLIVCLFFTYTRVKFLILFSEERLIYTILIISIDLHILYLKI